MAYYLGKKAEEFATHRWSLYVRGPQGEDISTFIEKVTFILHPSFQDPVRGKTMFSLSHSFCLAVFSFCTVFIL
jgi:YEATS domain-containing protein 4